MGQSESALGLRARHLGRLVRLDKRRLQRAHRRAQVGDAGVVRELGRELCIDGGGGGGGSVCVCV